RDAKLQAVFQDVTLATNIARRPDGGLGAVPGQSGQAMFFDPLLLGGGRRIGSIFREDRRACVRSLFRLGAAGGVDKQKGGKESARCGFARAVHDSSLSAPFYFLCTPIPFVVLILILVTLLVLVFLVFILVIDGLV